MLVVGCGREHPAVSGEHVHVEHRLVRAPVPPARALDPETCDGASERDRAQLWDAQRHQSVGQRRIDEVLVGRHAQHVGRAGVGVDREHTGEGGDVEPRIRCGSPAAEEIGRALGEAHRSPGRDGGVARAQLVDGVRLACIRRRQSLRDDRHRSTLPSDLSICPGFLMASLDVARPCSGQGRPVIEVRSRASG